jgi:predicted nucleic acid-binding protein
MEPLFAVYAEIERKSIIVEMQDPGDIPFAECAISFGCPIVTGNHKHFKHEKLGDVLILSPPDFIDYIGSFF